MNADRETLLRRAVEISLFTWRRDTPDCQPNRAARFGWWGDSFPTVGGDQIGSRLWQLQREKITARTLQRAHEYCREALQWLIDDGYVQAIDIHVGRGSEGCTHTTARAALDWVIAKIVLTSAAESAPISIHYDNMWQLIDGIPPSHTGSTD